MISDNTEYEINTQIYPVRYKRESVFSADNDSYLQQRAAAILSKCSKMRPYVLLMWKS